jgi:hypothetical protein
MASVYAALRHRELRELPLTLAGFYRFSARCDSWSPM